MDDDDWSSDPIGSALKREYATVDGAMRGIENIRMRLSYLTWNGEWKEAGGVVGEIDALIEGLKSSANRIRVLSMAVEACRERVE